LREKLVNNVLDKDQLTMRGLTDYKYMDEAEIIPMKTWLYNNSLG